MFAFLSETESYGSEGKSSSAVYRFFFDFSV